jgi:hypothetical protein
MITTVTTPKVLGEKSAPVRPPIQSANSYLGVSPPFIAGLSMREDFALLLHLLGVVHSYGRHFAFTFQSSACGLIIRDRFVSVKFPCSR